MGTIKSLRKLLLICLAVSMLIPALAACTQNSGANSNEERVLRFANGQGWIGEDGEFFREFTELYEFANPNVKLEFLQTMEEGAYNFTEPGMPSEQEDPLQKLMEAMEGPTPPDIVMIGYEQLETLINENLLTPLDTLITRDNYDTSDIVPTVIEGLKKAGNGTLYALAPTFYSSAVIYNKKIFDDAGVGYPSDDMTWDQLFDLARLVTKVDEENPVYGFAFNNYEDGNLFWPMISIYTPPLGLNFMDSQAEQMTVDSQNWENVWATLTDLYNAKVFPQMIDYNAELPRRDYGPYGYDLFLSGRAAMTIVNYGYLNQLINFNQNAGQIDNFNPVDWDLVALPTHPEAPGIGANIGYNGIMAINIKAQNQNDAWNFIKFITGDDWARIKSRSSYNLVVREKYIKPKEGMDYNVAAFTKLSPPEMPNYNELYRKYPDFWQVQNMGQQKMTEVLNGNKGVREALQEWQNEGNSMLQQMKENPNSGGVEGPIRPLEKDILIREGQTSGAISEDAVDMPAPMEAEVKVEADDGDGKMNAE